jgi:hypothetical protein
MSYRKITVDEKTYEYVIGKTHLKIKGFGLFENSKIGNFIVNGGPREQYLVTPGTVAKVIRGDTLPTAHHCKTHSVTTDDVVADPYHLAVTGKTRHIPYCPECYKDQRLGS